MSLGTLILILVSVLMSAAAQALLKLGVSGPRDVASADPGLFLALLGFLGRPAVLGGLALYGFGAVLWLGALSRTELSRAYPFVSLGFVLTALAGYFLFNEALGPLRIGGIVLIMLGVVLVAAS